MYDDLMNVIVYRSAWGYSICREGDFSFLKFHRPVSKFLKYTIHQDTWLIQSASLLAWQSFAAWWNHPFYNCHTTPHNWIIEHFRLLFDKKDKGCFCLYTWNWLILRKKYILCCAFERIVLHCSSQTSLLSITVPRYIYLNVFTSPIHSCPLF